MKFSCNYTTCKYNDALNWYCTRDYLSVGDFCNDDEPNCFDSILDTPEYQQEYWKAIKIGGKIYRRYVRGKCIKLNGFELFTRDHIPPEDTLNALDEELPEGMENIKCTEPNTGFSICLADVYANPEKVQAMIDQKPDVMSYPIWMTKVELDED